ncbi:MAG: diguanylate cyclase [Candidatus Thiodiazotropha sp. (ex Monitilora ramsayi)]|nr:diguanylate cyclase [Candidatus Thiodiazotropha sp. (ex Monitilora ramsayi)]
MSEQKIDNKHGKEKSKGRLLVVDDDIRHAESLAMMVSSWGYDVETAPDGAKAAGILVTRPIDVVLLDLHMPVADGHKVMDFIRKRKLTTRVIAISGDPSMDDAIKSLKKGADNFIRKPVAPVDLLKAIDESLKRRTQEAEVADVKRRVDTKNSLHRLMFDVAPNLLFLLDVNGHFRMVNNVFSKVTGYSKQELLGMHWKSLVENDEIERIEHVFEERRTTPDQFPEVELRLKCKEQSSNDPGQKPRTVLVALQSRRLYSVQEGKKVFFGTYGVARDITHYNKLEELNKYREFHDTLTGLPNRVLFDDYLNFALTQAKHSNTGLCLLNIVLDDLKQVNERYGHAAGDTCLKALATRLKRQVRKGDTLARIDGSEFLLLLPNIREEKSVVHLAEKIRMALTYPVIVEGKSISLQITVGTALFPRDAKDTDGLLQHAKIDFGAMAQSRKRQQATATSSNWIKLIKSNP